jgi:N-carbamoyl-L-amino-acid hydrolase
MAAAEFATALDALWAEREARGVPMACTLGRFHTDAKAHGLTIVPGLFHFSLDIRAYDAAVLANLEIRMHEIIAGIEQRRGVRFHLGKRASAAVGAVDPALRSGLENAARTQGIPVMTLGSPASHDAAAFAAAGVPMGMIFVRNENGSHNPREAMTMEDFLDGTAVLAQWVTDHLGFAFSGSGI